VASDKLELQIVTPEGVQLNETIDELTAPSVDGEFGVLPGHRPLLAALQTGLISYRVGNKTTQVAVGPGFVEIHEDKAVVLTDKYSTKEQIDPVRVRLELKDADAALDAFKGDPKEPEYVDLVQRELWAASLLELYGDPPPATIRIIAERSTQEDPVQIEGSTETDENVSHQPSAH
jgi:F-type H+-transporting ATPase subunit epsilon